MIKIKIHKEKLIGGLADNKPDDIYDSEELSMGISDEAEEHTKDKNAAKEIAKDHLAKNPHYYSDMQKSLKEKKAFKYPNKFGPKTAKKSKKTFKPLKASKKNGILKSIEKKSKQYKKDAGKDAAVIAGSGGFGSAMEEGKMNIDKRSLRRMIIEQIGRKQIEQEKLQEGCGDPQSYFGGMGGIKAAEIVPMKAVAKDVMPGVEPKKSVDIDPDGYEGKMAKGNLFKMAQYATRLHNMIQDNENLEPWVEEKIAVAASMLDSVAHYMEYEKMRG
jgi:hypothetical protein